MASEASGNAFCKSTGLGVPECSCRRCLEEMLIRFRPELLSEEIRITRTAEGRGRQASPRPDQPR